MMKVRLGIIISILLLLVESENIFAQDEYSNWFLYPNFILRFEEGKNPEIRKLPHKRLFRGWGKITISDNGGNLLAYGDFDAIFDKNNNCIYSCNKKTSRGSSFAVTDPLNEYRTYIFSVFTNEEKKGIFYTETHCFCIDFSSDDILFTDNLINKYKGQIYSLFLTAVLNEEGNKIWFISYNGEKKIVSYLIDDGKCLETVESCYTLDQISNTKKVNATNRDNKIYFVSQQDKLASFDFDCKSGKLSVFKEYEHIPCQFFGFSLSEKYLYTTDDKCKKIFCYDMECMQKVSEFTYNDVSIDDIQVASDGNIYTLGLYHYTSPSKGEVIGVIENPESDQRIFTEDILKLGNSRNLAFPRYYRFSEDFRYRALCRTFDFKYIGMAKTFLWDFGDNTKSSEKNPTHTFTNTGKYNVTLSLTYINGVKKIIEKEILVTDISSTPKIICE